MSSHERGQVITSAAKIYEEFFVPALFAEWPTYVLKAANVQTGDRVLDVGCGTGVLAREAARQVGPEGSVVGLDINKGMLAVAQRKTTDITWQQGDAHCLPFDDESFARVVSQFSLMFYTDPPAAVAEMNRVLCPGGAAAVAVWGPLEETPGYAAMTGILDELFGAEAANSLQAPYMLGDRARLKSIFTNAGIADISIQTRTGQARFPSIESWIYTDIRGWTLADIIDEEGYERLKRYTPGKLSRFMASDGSVRFDAPAHIVSWERPRPGNLKRSDAEVAP